MTGLSEFELIETLLKPLAHDTPGAFGLTDDAAVLPDLNPGDVHVVTKDALAVGVHMLSGDPPESMAKKAIRVNLSDLAAMGARPECFFMGLSFGENTDDAFLRAFVSGLTDDCVSYGLSLMGGDVIRTPGSFTVSITMIGVASKDKVLRRNGAQPGESLWVSGTLGDAALALLSETDQLAISVLDHKDLLVNRYRVPQPRLELGQALPGLASACIDISDGLVADVGHICETSGVGCEIQASTLPLSGAAEAALAEAPDVIETILTGGDDYELAFAAPPSADTTLTDLSKSLDIALSKVGTFTEQGGVRVLDGSGSEMIVARAGFQHI